MLAEISEKILEFLEDAGIETRQIDYKEIVDRQVGSLQRPAVNISINTGTFEKVTLVSRKLNLVVSLFLIIQNLSSEKNRRFDAYRLIETISTALFLVNLDLELQDLLKPAGFSNVTDNTFAGAGYQLFKIDFTCSYIVTKEEEDLGALRSLVNSYALGSDQTILTSVLNGGKAFSDGIDVIFGGRARTQRFAEDVIWGGNANSTYNN
ncbi:MAG TPA: hypothetical protein VMX17_16035 [Candidatus Glassbacteria bacterium]|nr:hypothetical protein [Candidatus Glassbacteria bacterium]